MSKLRLTAEVDPEPAPLEARPVPSRVARLLALAHGLGRQIESGGVEGLASVARDLGLTRARVTQVLQLRNLAAPIQEALLNGELRASERSLRAIATEPSWDVQLNAVGGLVRKHESRLSSPPPSRSSSSGHALPGTLRRPLPRR